MTIEIMLEDGSVHSIRLESDYQALPTREEIEKGPYDQIWIATAPIGRPSSGPTVCYSEGVADDYFKMGWTISGPYSKENS